MSAAALTVLPKAMGAHSTPFSWLHRGFLVRAQHPGKGHVDECAALPLVVQLAADAVLAQQ